MAEHGRFIPHSHMRRHFSNRAGAGETSAGSSSPIITDVTGALAQFNLQGPKSRGLMQVRCYVPNLRTCAHGDTYTKIDSYVHRLIRMYKD